MRRATFTQNRDPREQTPDANMVKITNTGQYLLTSEIMTMPITIGREKRFN